MMLPELVCVLGSQLILILLSIEVWEFWKGESHVRMKAEYACFRCVY